MGETLSLIEKGIRIVETLVNIGIKVYNCIEEKIIKRKDIRERCSSYLYIPWVLF